VNPTLAAVAALLAAFCFAVATIYQHRGVVTAPSGAFLRARLLRHLLHRPVWLAGVAVAFVGIGLHTAALALGSLALVQPLLVASVLFTLALSPALANRRPHPRQWRAGVVAVLALAGFLAATRPGPGRLRMDTTIAVPLLAAVVGAGLLLAVASVRRRGEAALRLGVAAGLLYAVGDSLVKDAAGWLSAAPGRAVGTGSAAAAVGLVGLVLHQSALQASSPAPVMAAITTTEPVISVIIGVLAFHERLAAGDWALAGAAALFVVLAAAVRMVTSAPDIRIPRAGGPKRPNPRRPGGRPGVD
jgi:drug/metabolite transporter (DMT)-like permease